MIVIFAVTILLASLSVVIHYEFLVGIKRMMPAPTETNDQSSRPRRLVCAVVLMLLCAHTLEILVFAVAYQGIVQILDFGNIQGADADGFLAVVYFSFCSYTTLGTGDLFPVGALRILSGFEGLLGFLLIGWSASFLYLEMRDLRF